MIATFKKAGAAILCVVIFAVLMCAALAIQAGIISAVFYIFADAAEKKWLVDTMTVAFSTSCLLLIIYYILTHKLRINRRANIRNSAGAASDADSECIHHHICGISPKISCSDCAAYLPHNNKLAVHGYDDNNTIYVINRISGSLVDEDCPVAEYTLLDNNEKYAYVMPSSILIKDGESAHKTAYDWQTILRKNYVRIVRTVDCFSSREEAMSAAKKEMFGHVKKYMDFKEE